MLHTAEMSAPSPSVTVLVAAYNEAPVIGAVVSEARRALPTGEVLVVDDGSTDGTDRAAADAGARVLRLAANGGKGSAIRRGLPEARGDVIVLIDGDGQDDPAEIPAAAGGPPSGRRPRRRLALHRHLRARRDHAR